MGMVSTLYTACLTLSLAIGRSGLFLPLVREMSLPLSCGYLSCSRRFQTRWICICFQVIHPSPEPAGMTSFLAVSLPPDSCPDKTGEFLSVPIGSRKVRLETDWKITGIVRKHPTGIRRQRTSRKRLGNGRKRRKPAGSDTEIAGTGRLFEVPATILIDLGWFRSVCSVPCRCPFVLKSFYLTRWSLSMRRWSMWVRLRFTCRHWIVRNHFVVVSLPFEEASCLFQEKTVASYRSWLKKHRKRSNKSRIYELFYPPCADISIRYDASRKSSVVSLAKWR